MSEGLRKMFVYGSLRKGFGNHYLLERSNYLGEALTDAAFTMLHLGGYPGVVRAGSTQILGEVYEVDDKTLSRLDRLEGHPSFYRRTPIRVTEGSNADRWQDVETYLLPTDWLSTQKTVVESGDWTKRNEGRKGVSREQ